MNKIIFILLFALCSIYSHAAKITDDELKIGEPGSSENKVIKLGDEVIIRNNKATGQAEISEDSGSNYKRFGTGGGSGGGENFNNGLSVDENPNAESGTTGWTASAGDFFTTNSVADWAAATSYTIGDFVVESGIIYEANTDHTSSGTFATDTANWDEIIGADALEGDASFVWIPAAQNDTLTSSVLDFNKDIFKGTSCQSLITYIGGDENLSLKVLNADNEELDSETLKAHGISSNESGFFLCPSDADITADADKGNLRFRLENTGATAAAAIKFDKSYVGTLIGLSDTTLPDVFSWRINASDGSVDFNTGGVVSGNCTKNSTGNYTCSTPSLTSVPNCTGNVTTSAGNATYAISHNIAGSTATSQNILVVEYNGTAFGNSVVVSCQKTGADAKQQVQVYKSIPKVSENENVFSASISQTGVVSLENTDFINGDCTVTGTSDYTCDISTMNLSTSLVCSCTAIDGGGNNRACTSKAPSSTQILYNTHDDTNADVARPVNIVCQKAGADYKKPVVQPVIVGQVTNSYADSISKNVATETCFITNSGTPALASDLCDNWIDSIVDVTTGETRINFKSGYFKTNPNCTMSVTGNFVASQTSTWNTSQTTVRTFVPSTLSLSDANFWIICQGEI